MFACVFSDNSPSPLRIESLAFCDDITVTKFGPGRINYYTILYVLKGDGVYNGNHVMEGQGFLFLPDQIEEHHGNKDNPWELLWVISSDDNMKEIFKRYNANPETLIFNYNSVPEIRRIANKIISKNNSRIDSLKVLELFLLLINSHSHQSDSLERKLNSDTYLDFCTNYIDTNIHSKITVDELSLKLGVSQPYLYKIFRNKLNMSPKQYISWCKINRAKEFLSETDMTITQIANSVGYDDALAFSKAFSLKEKISPKQYRESATKVNK